MEYSHDDLIRIVSKEIEQCGNDTNKIIDKLMELAEQKPDLMLVFTEHGFNIIRAIAEKSKGTVH